MNLIALVLMAAAVLVFLLPVQVVARRNPIAVGLALLTAGIAAQWLATHHPVTCC